MLSSRVGEKKQAKGDKQAKEDIHNYPQYAVGTTKIAPRLFVPKPRTLPPKMFVQS